MIDARNTNYSAVSSVQSGQQVNWDEYGIDEDGPPAGMQSDYSVTVPASPVNLRDEHLLPTRTNSKQHQAGRR